jgi:hypothetical protein
LAAHLDELAQYAPLQRQLDTGGAGTDALAAALRNALERLGPARIEAARALLAPG